MVPKAKDSMSPTRPFGTGDHRTFRHEQSNALALRRAIELDAADEAGRSREPKLLFVAKIRSGSRWFCRLNADRILQRV